MGITIFANDLLGFKDVVLERDERLETPVFILTIPLFNSFYFICFGYFDFTSSFGLIYFVNLLDLVIESRGFKIFGVDGFDETFD